MDRMRRQYSLDPGWLHLRKQIPRCARNDAGLGIDSIELPVQVGSTRRNVGPPRGAAMWGRHVGPPCGAAVWGRHSWRRAGFQAGFTTHADRSSEKPTKAIQSDLNRSQSPVAIPSLNHLRRDHQNQRVIGAVHVRFAHHHFLAFPGIEIGVDRRGIHHRVPLVI